MPNRIRHAAGTLLSLASILAAAGVARAQGGGAPPPQPPPAGDPAGPDAPTDDEIVDLPIIPADEPPVPPPANEGPPPLAVVYDKGVLFTTPDKAFEARLALRTQFRFETRRSTADGAQFEQVFYAPRIRLQLEGNAFGEINRYKLEAGLGEAGSFSFVKDFFLERKVGPVWIRGGQWKRPFNRQEIVSDFGSSFNERAITAEFVGGGRDLGVAIHNDYEKTPEGLEWVLGIFNDFSGGDDRPVQTVDCTEDPVEMTIDCAAGRPRNFPDDWDPAIVVRAGWNKGKVKGYTEGDLDGGPLRFGVGASYKIDLANFKKGGEESVAKNMSHGVQLDGIVKVQGFDVLIGLYLMKLKSADAQMGFLVQAGYFVMPKKLLIAGRFAAHETADPDTNELEGRLAVNWHFAGHAYKLANDIGFLKATGEANKPEIQVRLMAQLTF
jgi:hypothetical protein